MNETITGKIEKLVAGGDGIIRDANGAVFVPFVAAGEVVTARLREKKGKTRYADVVKIDEPSPDHIVAPCKYFGECGGCQWQHLTYDAQLRSKTAILAESLSWIGKIETEIAEIVPSPKQYEYRSRVRLHIRNKKVGFFATGREKLVPIDKCLIAHDSLNAAMPAIGKILSKFKAVEIEIADTREAIIALARGETNEKRYRLDKDKWVEDDAVGGGFTQVNPEQNNNLKKIVRDALKKIKGGRALELFAGSGNFTADLMKVADSVVAVELDRDAVAVAIEKFGGAGGARFVRAESSYYVRRVVEDNEKFDLILLDPPRTGAKDCLESMMKLKPATIVYVSCDPATLARDLKTLSAKYRVDSVAPIDMFPQTAHIESVATLSRI